MDRPERAAARQPVGRAAGATGVVLLAAAAGAFGSLDSALNVAFPRLAEAFEVETADLRWVVITFVLPYGGLLLGAGQLGDRHGHRRVLSAGAAGSVAAMVLCAIAPNYTLFLLARIAQGVATALVMATAPAIASLAAGDEHRGSAVGVFQMAAGIGGAVGPIIGGPLTSLGGWQAVFWFRVPVALGLLGLALSVRVDQRERSAASDVAGAVLTAFALGAVLLAVNLGGAYGWGSMALLGSAAGAAGLVALFVRRSLNHPTPVIDLRRFRDRRFAAPNLLNVMASGAMFVAWLLVPALIIDEMGRSEQIAGLVLAASPLAMAVVSPGAGRWADRVGPRRPVVLGLVVETVGLVVLAAAGQTSSPVLAAVALAAIGAGLGLFSAPNMALVMAAMPDDQQGVAGGLAQLMRTIGIVTGVAGSGAIFGALEVARPFESAFGTTTLISAAVAALGVVLAASTRDHVQVRGS